MTSLAQSFRLHEEVRLYSRESDFVVLRANEYDSYQDVRDFVAAYSEASAQTDTQPQLIDIEVANNVHGTFVVNHEFELPLHDPGAQNTVAIRLTTSHPGNQPTLESLVALEAHHMVKAHMELNPRNQSTHIMRYIVIAEPIVD